MLRRAVLPGAAAAALAAAAAAGVSTTRPLLLLQLRQSAADSVHGAGRALTNLHEFIETLSVAVAGGRRSAARGGAAISDGEVRPPGAHGPSGSRADASTLDGRLLAPRLVRLPSPRARSGRPLRALASPRRRA
eukprot:1596506-Prymnesium_polylepis.1